MGDLTVRVCMGDYVVEDRLLRFRGVAWIGDCLNAHVAFPGASIPVVRVGEVYRLRGRTLEEGEELRITLGKVDVWVRHHARFRGPSGSSPFIDTRFLAVAALMVAVGSWVDAAEAWIAHQPATETSHGGAALKRLVERVREPVARQQVAAVRVRRDARGRVEHVQRIADGPRHLPDDSASRTAFYRWYRSVVPADPMARAASERLAVDVTDGVARRTLANAAYNADRFESAAWHYQMLTWADQVDGGALLGLARSQRRRGRHASEIQVYRRILATWEDHPGALAGLTTALGRMGRLDEAAATLEQLQTVAPEDPYTEMTAATLAALEGRNVDALDALDRAVLSRGQLAPDQQIELRRDLALDPGFASLRKDKRLRALLRRHLGAAAPRPVR
jgi:tetratricopeptide (TPR) repeat protein